MIPPTVLLRRYDTHCLIPSQYSGGGDSVLTRIADDDAHLADIFDLDNATNDRLLGEAERLDGIGLDELVSGVPYARIVNAAYCHAHPLGSRFNGPARGAWYAAFELATAQAEIAFHKAIELAECGWRDAEMTYDDYLADFSAQFHDLRLAPQWRDCLAPDSYLASQELAERLLEAGGLGVVYPSVRAARGTCLACFRPALVMNVRKGPTYRLAISGTGAFEVAEID